MTRFELMAEIEKTRSHLLIAANTQTLSSKNVLTLSTKLDKLINQYQKTQHLDI
ncbi:aspartyl-phosphate phosphatase Spo0E family protein [Scopulibacillus cellulosilyticus]|uniref:Aspartyl-phosphate phosphatase Spo0E family protein n=1 Tax=Scopulibacillus cellulosilyticus TaxID=2665665 RepID=A0ABW2Q4N5_9BACL